MTPEEIMGKIEEKYGILEWLYEECVEETYSAWLDGLDGANEGQHTLYWNYLEPAGGDVLDDWAGSWPDVYGDDYMMVCLDSHEAAEQTWSDTLYEINTRQWEIIEHAQEVQWAIEMLEMLLPI